MFKTMQPYLWWKRYITQMQLVQFVLIFVHSTYFLLDSNCDCPKPLVFLQCAHAVLFFTMFYYFYLSAYKREQKLKKAKLEEAKLNSLDNSLDCKLDKKDKPKEDVKNNAQLKKTN